MTLVPFTDCCLLLGVDPKTLRRWLTSAHLSCTRHPTDARLKCLASSQVQQLASLHDRILPDPLPGEARVTVASASADAQASLPPDLPATPSGLAASPPEAELRHQLAHLQAQVASLQEHVTQLALALVREQQWHWELRVASSPSALPAPVVSSPPAPSAPKAHRTPASAKTVAPTEATHPRSRALTLIEQGVDGQYVLIAPTQGVLAVTPDSPEWFDWLAGLTSFTFRCQHGSFCATRKFRDRQRIQSWNVHRSLHGRSCTLYLGLTSALTIARLQDMALTVQARLTLL